MNLFSHSYSGQAVPPRTGHASGIDAYHAQYLVVGWKPSASKQTKCSCAGSFRAQLGAIAVIDRSDAARLKKHSLEGVVHPADSELGPFIVLTIVRVPRSPGRQFCC